MAVKMISLMIATVVIISYVQSASIGNAADHTSLRRKLITPTKITEYATLDKGIDVNITSEDIEEPVLDRPKREHHGHGHNGHGHHEYHGYGHHGHGHHGHGHHEHHGHGHHGHGHHGYGHGHNHGHHG